MKYSKISIEAENLQIKSVCNELSISQEMRKHQKKLKDIDNDIAENQIKSKFMDLFLAGGVVILVIMILFSYK